MDVRVYLCCMPIYSGVVTLFRSRCRWALGVLGDLRSLAASGLAGVRVLALRETLGSRRWGTKEAF